MIFTNGFILNTIIFNISNEVNKHVIMKYNIYDEIKFKVT